MTIEKMTVMLNDCLTKQERLAYRFGLDLWLSFSRGAKGKAPIQVVCQGCLLTGVTGLNG
jgi:hypothetical protein